MSKKLSSIIIRKYKPGEEEELWKLYYETTHQINKAHYTKKQLERWAPADTDMKKWKERLKEKEPVLAEENGSILGFAELEPDGHIDYFYCHYQHQGKGVGKKLYEAIEEKAKQLGPQKLFADVSVTAKPFFFKDGF